MRHFLFLLSLTFFLQSTAQHTIYGKLTPAPENKVMLLYKAEGAFQYFKANINIDENGLFGFSLPENFPIGMYRLVYDTEKNQYINVIYNNENISFVADPNNIVNSIQFAESRENELFFSYIKNINIKYLEQDSIQKLYYADNKNKSLVKAYQEKTTEIQAYQNFFEKEARNTLAYHFIQSYKKSSPVAPPASKDAYYQYLKENYLQHIAFTDTVLHNSSFIVDRLNEYLFDLNEAIAKRQNTALDTNMVNLAFSKLPASTFKNEVMYAITNSAFDPYSSQYDVLLNHLYERYYQQIPAEICNPEFTKMLLSKLQVIVGKKAPNIAMTGQSLYQLKADSTLVIFWSTTCSHCMKEIPEVYELLKDNAQLKVVLVGLEEENSDWESIIKDFPMFMHYKAMGKWDNEYAQAYNIKSTPAYFMLDAQKIIIAKPDNIQGLKNLLGR
jgi:thiol-disulfide isomerase/thioredoxin